MCHSGSMSNYQKRKIIQKEEILQTMQAIAMIKNNSERIRNKPYFPKRMFKVMMTCFFICRTVLCNKEIIEPYFEKRELRDFMKYPIPFISVISFKSRRLSNIMLYMIGVLPPSLSIIVMRIMIKINNIL